MAAATGFITALALLSAAPVITPAFQHATATAIVQAPQAPPKIDGDWNVLLGPKENLFKGSLAEKGGQITGVMGDETAEYPVKGTINGADVKFSFTIYEGGADVLLVITGRFEGETIKGTAKLGNANMEVSVIRTSKY